jgi:DNA-binding LacI/PurR family transcriptional regulator
MKSVSASMQMRSKQDRVFIPRDTATIHDVARQARVAPATVSRVINGTAPVSDATRSQVLKAISDLNFVPSPSARKLSMGKTMTIACIVPFFTRPSFVERLSGVVSTIEESNYEVVVYNVETEKRRNWCFNEVPRPDRCDGVIVMSMTPNDSDYASLARYGLPVVLVDGFHEAFASVSEDSFAGAQIAIEHLVQLGHKRIGFIGGPLQDTFNFQATSTARRLGGYRRAMSEAAFAIDDDLICIDNLFAIGKKSIEIAGEFTRQLMAVDNPPTAIFASSDIQAIGVMQTLRAMNIRVPEDVSVVGYDDIELAEYLQLTTINQALRLSGAMGAQKLLSMLGVTPTDQANVPSSMYSHVPLKLVVRGTTAQSATEASNKF